MESSAKRVEINLYDTVQKLFPKTLIKDLTEHERICPVCNGLGMKIEDNIYGIKGDTSEAGKKSHFPYKHQALSFCQSCYNGVQRLCPYCNEPFKNQAYMHCSCEGQKKADEEERLKRSDNKVSKAVEVTEKEVSTMLYCDETDRYFLDINEFVEDWYGDHDKKDEKPDRLWVTSVGQIQLDSDSILENACEELHEEAMESICIDDKIRLQEFLDDWCKKQTGTTTYYPCYEKYVIVDWNKYKE